MKWELASPFALRVLDAAKRPDANLVGGAVRDLLLGAPFGDVDLLTTSRAGDVARPIAAALGGKVREYPEFLTAKIIVGREPAVDVASARRERYALPGALPEVSPGTLEEDLFRRDFTVNAICLRLQDEQIVDPHGGVADLRSRTLRVLHSRSFIDDPTRILRGLRIGSRLGLMFDGPTETLAREAIDGGAMESVSRERLWRELLFAVREPDPASPVLALIDSGAIERLTGLRQAPEPLRRSLAPLTQVLARHPALDRDAAILGALLRGQIHAEGLLAGSGFSARRRAKILAVAAAPVERRQLPETLAVDAAENPGNLARVEKRLAVLSSPLPFRGGDLGVPPGPHIGRAMRRTREALVEGEISEGQARDFARRAALQYLNERIPRER